MYQLKITSTPKGNAITILHNGEPLHPLVGLLASKEEALQVGKLLEAANDAEYMRNELTVALENNNGGQNVERKSRKLHNSSAGNGET